MEKKIMTIHEAIVSGKMCEDCIYYNDCYYNRDCIAMAFLKWTAEEYENLHSDNSTGSGDKA